MRKLLLTFLAGAAAACTADLGDTQPWTAPAEIPAPFTPEILAPPATTAATAATTTLRVVTFNVERGDSPVATAHALLADPDLAAADVYLIQEIEDQPGEGGSRAARLAAEMDVGFVYAPARREAGGTHGLAMLSRHPLENVEVMALPFADLNVLSVRRIALAADIATPAGPVRFVTMHLDTRLNVSERILQLRPTIIDADPDAPIVVAGDFNTNPYVWAGATVPLPPVDAVVDTDQAPILDDYVRALDFDTPTAACGPTQHVAGLSFRLDAIYTRGLVTGPPHVARHMDVSDHWPLWIDVDVPSVTNVSARSATVSSSPDPR